MLAHRVTWTVRRGQPDTGAEITHLGGGNWVLTAREVMARIKASMDACGDVFIVETAGETAIVTVVNDAGGPQLQAVVDGVPTDHLLRLPCLDTPQAARP